MNTPAFDIDRSLTVFERYVSTYRTECAWQGYGRATFTEDMLFGIAIALGYASSPQGLDAFKAELLARFQKEAAEKVIWQAEQSR